MAQPTRVLDKFIEGKCFPGRFDPNSGVQGSPRFIVLHIQQGTNESSLNHFRTEGVEASSTVLIGKDGEVWRVIREADGPWTNGVVRRPTARAQEGILALGGNPNVWSLTIETEGFSGDEPPAAQLDAIVWQIRDWQSRFGIPAGRVIRHADIDQVERSFCPGDALYERVLGVIGGGGGEVFGEPGAFPPFDGSDQRFNGVEFHAEERTVEAAVDGLNCRVFALSSSPRTRAPLELGAKFRVIYWVEGEAVDGENRWWVTPRGSRVWAGGTVEKPTAA